MKKTLAILLAPAASTYLTATEELVFTGTAATNGWLRLVFE